MLKTAVSLAFAALAASLSATARADIYRLTSLTTSGDYSQPMFYGLTDDDTVVLSNVGFDREYGVYAPGQLGVFSPVAPTGVVYDDGSACGASDDALCNGPFTAAIVFDGVGDDLVTTDGAGLPVVFSEGYGTLAALNRYGDIVFTDSQGTAAPYTFYLATDLSSRVAPEPSTLALLGTGLVGVVGAARGRGGRAKRRL